MSFDCLAPHYRWMEAVLAGGLLQRCRTRWLNETPGAKRVLLAGEGNGRMLVACARALPEAEFVVLDQSKAMLSRARRALEKAGHQRKVAFRQGDIRAWRDDNASFDLIVTNFFLDCFAAGELSRVVGNISAGAAPGARWLVSDFAVPGRGWQRVRARIVLALAYGFFRVTTGISAGRIVIPDEHLRQAGFVLQCREHFNHGLLHSDLWERPK